MALRINNNIAAINAHRNLVNTTMNLSKSMEKLSSGYRINRAADNPAGLVISEQFRAQIAGLNQAINNSEGSINMIQTAEGALNEINNLLVSMRELAIHAANEGFNDTAQLEADQAEIDNAIKTIDRIAANTQFGTKLLLDGTKANIATITSSNSVGLTVRESYLSTGDHSVTAQKVSDSSATINTTSYGLDVNSSVTPSNLTEGIHNIDVIQASSGASKLTSKVNIYDAWNNALEFGAATAEAIISSAATINGAATDQHKGTYAVKLNFQQDGESPTGWQEVTVDVTATMTEAEFVQAWNDEILANAELQGRVVATQTANGTFQFRTVNQGSNYSVAVSDFSYTGAGAAIFTMADSDARGVAKNEFSIDIDVAKTTVGHATITVTAGTYDSIGKLVGTLQGLVQVSHGTVEGSGVGTVENIVVAQDGDDRISFTLRDEGSDYSFQVESQSEDSTLKALGLTADQTEITGTDALVAFDNYTNTISSVDYGSTQNVVLYNAAADDSSRGSVGMTVSKASQGVNLGNMLLDVSAARFDVRLDSGPATTVTAGIDTLIYNAARTESIKVKLDLTANSGSETISNTDQSLVFQIGANVGQTANISLPNMAASALGKSLSGNMFNSLAEIDVMTPEGAQDAQSVIDYAIQEVSTVRGTLGSFQKNTLESNLRNLRIASQNLQSSESNIRDTDMAKEMSNFVKNQILLQAGTSMLAQSNQVPQVVLSLFG